MVVVRGVLALSAGIWNNRHGLSGHLELALHLEPQGAGTPAGA